MQRGKSFYGQCLLLTILLLGLLVPSWAGDQSLGKEMMKLDPLIQEALQNNPELVAEQAQVKGMQERVPQSKSLDDPELTIRLWNTPNLLDAGAATSVTKSFGWFRSLFKSNTTALDRVALPERERKSLSEQMGVLLEEVPSNYEKYIAHLKKLGVAKYGN